MQLVEAVYSDKVRGVVSKIVRSSDVDDAIQEAAISAWQSRSADVEDYNPEAFAMTIAKRRACSLATRNKIAPKSDNKCQKVYDGHRADCYHAVAVVDRDEIDESEQDIERKRLVASLFARLRADQAAAFRMRHADGMSITEVAQAMGIEYRQVASLLATAARALRRDC